MNIKSVQILSEAENDLREGRAFYDAQDPKIGDYFWDSLLSDIESLAIFAGIHKMEFGFYRMFSKRFPYAIYYGLADDVASVVAVLPVRKNPLWIKAKMGGIS
jgi:plasmid stabilization system protein ParE